AHLQKHLVVELKRPDMAVQDIVAGSALHHRRDAHAVGVIRLEAVALDCAGLACALCVQFVFGHTVSGCRFFIAPSTISAASLIALSRTPTGADSARRSTAVIVARTCCSCSPVAPNRPVRL